MNASPNQPTNTLLCFGLGYSARVLTEYLDSIDAGTWRFIGTRTRVDEMRDGAIAILPYAGDHATPDLRAAISSATHILVSIPPDLEGDPVVRDFGAALTASRSIRWIGYLSTIGVYGDAGGAWIDEDTPPRPMSERALRRLRAESQWRAIASESGKRVDIFRLPGIYGPGRSVIDALRTGTAKRVVKPEQVFNRIHVVDIAHTLTAAIQIETTHHIFNVCDDEPAPPQDVVAYAAELLGLPPPPEIDFQSANLSDMARSFYAENKRVKNTRIKTDLGVELAFPTYREGLLEILRNR